MAESLDDTQEARRRRKRIALTLAALALVLLVITIIWWGNLADDDVEQGTVSVAEGITDSADDAGGSE